MEISREKTERVLKVSGMTMGTYLEKFEWDLVKYPTQYSINGIEEIIEKHLSQIEEDRIKLGEEYINAFQELEAVERYQNGSLQQRNVSLEVQRDDFVLGSEYLMTAVVIVPKSRYKEWEKCYERIDREIVPRSSQLILEDEEHGLYTITLFKRHLDIFKERARQLKFYIKDFVYDEEKIEKERETLFDLRFKKNNLYNPLVKWLKTNFGEAYSALVHIQSLIVQVECILRYGIPAKYFVVLLTIPDKEVFKLRQSLMKEYAYLDELTPDSNNKTSIENEEDIPFVFLRIFADFCEFK